MPKLPAIVIEVEIEREAANRWIADAVNLPGVLVYGTSELDAFRRVQALVLQVIGDRLSHGEDPLTGHVKRSAPVSGIRFHTATRQTALAL